MATPHGNRDTRAFDLASYWVLGGPRSRQAGTSRGHWCRCAAAVTAGADQGDTALTQITILLALYDGAAYLAAQLDSYLAQDMPDWALLVGDDGSRDAGPGIVADYARAAKPGQIRLVPGPRRGGSANFLHLLALAPVDVPYTCFSDQDDVWLAHKLSRATDHLAAVPPDTPALYFSRTLICNADLSGPRPSRRPARPVGFRNALVQNVIAGNTIVVNRAALALLQKAYSRLDPGLRILAHDWWVYLVLSGAGAQFIADAEPGLLYRQHADNQIGANDGLAAGLRRLGMMWRGTYGDWNAGNIAAISPIAADFTPENQALLKGFAAARTAPGPLARLRGIIRTGVYRQTRLSQLALYLAALTSRL
jgi:glycosyltransferase involved in cell wall biosynthesis